MLSPTGPASTLEEIAARLKDINNGAQDVSALPTVVHEASRLSFRVGPMSRADYDAWNNLKTFEDLKHESSGAAKNNAPKDRDRSDAYLLTHAVFSESGEKLSDEIAKLILNGPGFGPSTHTLCEAAAAKNPPRAELTGRFAYLYGMNRGLVVLVRVLEKAGLMELLADRLSPDDSPAKIAACEDLKKWMASLEFWEAVLEAEDAAKQLGISVYDAAELNASVAT